MSQLIWLQNSLNELGVFLLHPPVFWHDNNGATYLSRVILECSKISGIHPKILLLRSSAHLSINPMFHARTKHVAIIIIFSAKRLLQAIYLSSLIYFWSWSTRWYPASPSRWSLPSSLLFSPNSTSDVELERGILRQLIPCMISTNNIQGDSDPLPNCWQYVPEKGRFAQQ